MTTKHADKHSDYHGNSISHGNAHTNDHANLAHENIAHSDSGGVHSNSHSDWYTNHTDDIEV